MEKEELKQIKEWFKIIIENQDQLAQAISRIYAYKNATFEIKKIKK